ncbi:flagellar filament structural protein [Ketogulonicigenium robustum]|uniref:Flagellin n=1 Tax=Ketogulonicigenium robustum TaxID=92947 RepID=A0A1W6P1S7_9RHOB|nr:flagellin [Ketogulonicigenium robustum]ARO15399.1 flagellar filament structural protein [Ketogulonicigenium robustum]
MSSILTNNGAMVALQTLKATNNALTAVQAEISTGKSVANSKDNAAVWAISKVMESDVQGFTAIQDTLSLGESTVSVARQAAESIASRLNAIKDNIVNAQTANVDRAKLQVAIDADVEQIKNIVATAQFSGMNLIDGGTATASFLASLDRKADGSVGVSTIDVTGQNLSTGDYVATAVFGATTDGVTANSDAAAFNLDGAGGTGTIEIDAAATYAAGDKISLNIGGKTATYTVSEADAATTTPADMIAVGLKNAVDALGIEGLTVDYDSATAGTLAFTNDGTKDLTVGAQFKNAGAGGLSLLNTIDVSSDASALSALNNIDGILQTAVDAAAAFGAVESRISTQADFVSKLTDALKSGIGSMVDADMEAASARLQALQVQQQLGVQALSIANQSPQSLLSLFQ